MIERFKAITIAITLIGISALTVYLALSSGRVSISRSGRDFAYRDKNPVSFWFWTGMAILGMFFGTFSLLVALFGSML